MTQPAGFTMQINEHPENGAMCDVCTSFIVIGTKRVSTFIGTSPQSNLCLDCAEDTAGLVKAKRVRAESVAVEA